MTMSDLTSLFEAVLILLDVLWITVKWSFKALELVTYAPVRWLTYIVGPSLILFWLSPRGFYFLIGFLRIPVGLALDLFVGPPPVLVEVERELPVLPIAFMGGAFVLSLCLNVWALTRKPKIVRMLPRYDQVSEFMVERVVDGSQYFQTAPPAFQAVLFCMREGQWWRSGVCFRVELGLMTCWHVIADAERVKIVSGVNELEIDVAKFKHLDRIGDVALADVAVPFLKQAKMAKVCLTPKDQQMVMVHNGTMASMGPLKSMDAFGLVKYSGSTSPGFSGAPYFMGNTVFGMHFGAAACNMGYEAAYLDMCVRREDYDEYYRDLISREEVFDFKQSPYDPSDVMVRIRGKMITMDRDDFEEALEARRQLRRESMPRAPAVPVSFADPENFDRPAVPQSSAGRSSVKAEAVPVMSVQSSSETPSPSQESGSPSSTVAPGLTRAPKNVVLSCTSESTPGSTGTVRLELESKQMTALAKEILRLKNDPQKKKRRKRSTTLLTSTSSPGSEASPASN